MKRFLYLCNFEFKRLSRLIFVTLGLMVVVQLVLMHLYRKENYQWQNHRYIPYEEFLSSSGIFIVFFLAFGAISVFFLLSILSNYHGSKSIYTLMTLPQDRSLSYFSKLASGFLSFLTLFASQLISVIIGYVFYAPKIATIVQTTQYPYVDVTIFKNAKNGLFLAFIRSDFLRVLFPLSLEGVTSTIVIIIVFVTGLYFSVLCERSCRYFRITVVLIQVGYIIYVLNYRINSVHGLIDYQNLYVHSVIMLMFAIFFVWDSIRLIHINAIC